ncbi:MAG: putative glycoside hydrolase, partial [Steroidobacteraceae bacterium]
NGDVMLLIRLRREGAASAPVSLAMRCGSKCAGAIAFDAALASVPSGQWKTIGVPLKCFQKAGADVTKIDAPLAISTEGSLDLGLSHVALGTVTDHVVACP